MAPAKDKWVRRFIIPETTRHRKGFTIYKVTSVVYLKTSREEVSKVSVWKRYNDFKKLHSTLYALYTHFQIKEPFPSFPKSKFFGRFEVEVIQERKNSALKLLDFIGRHQCLYTSDIFIRFFESSLVNSNVSDCSQSIGSDTSEDDHNINLNNTSLANNILTENLYHNVSKSSHKELKNTDLALNSILETDARSLTVEQKQFLHDTVVPSKEYNKECHSTDTLSMQVGENIPTSNKILNLDINVSKIHDKLDNQSNQCGNVISNREYDLKNRRTPKVRDPKTIYDGSDLVNTCEDITHYIVVAAAYVSAAFKHEAIAEYEEAFAQYKMGISTLLLGVETDPNDARKIIVKEKISKYLDRAERLYNRYLNWNISVLNKSILDLQNYKVLKIINSVMLVKDLRLNCIRIVKSIEKSLCSKENISNYILRGQVPFMVRLHAYIETETTVFLILEYAKHGKLWDYIIKNYKPHDKSILFASDSSESFSINDKYQSALEGIYNFNNEIKLISTEIVPNFDTTLTKMKHITLKNEGNVQCQKETDDIYKSDMPTTQLLEKAQKLLQSVNATLKRSNSVAIRLNESKELMYPQDNIMQAEESDDICQFDKLNVVYNYEQNENVCISNNVQEKEMFESLNIAKKNFVINNNDKLTDDTKNMFNRNNLNKCLSNSLDFSFCNVQKKSILGSTSSEISSNSIPDDTKHNQNCTHNRIDDNFLQSQQTKNAIKQNNATVSCSSKKFKSTECAQSDKCVNFNIGLVHWDIPEDVVRSWAAEILLALEALHQQGVIIFDLKPENILLDDYGHAMLTYIVPYRNIELTKVRQPYSSPELYMFSPTTSTTTATDIWNYGIILYELLTGIKFKSLHPEPFRSHSIISIPGELSDNATSLLLNILKYEPEERLTISDIKKHCFFEKIDWSTMAYSTIY